MAISWAVDNETVWLEVPGYLCLSRTNRIGRFAAVKFGRQVCELSMVFCLCQARVFPPVTPLQQRKWSLAFEWG